METLVMSQVAPGIGQHSYHHPHMMVGGNSHHEDEDTQTPAQRQSDRGNSSVPATPQSSTTSRNSSQQQPTQSAGPHPSRQTNTSTRPETQRNASYISQHAINNHSRGFDQSGFPLSNDPRAFQASPSSPRLQPTYRSTLSLGGSEATSPSRIKVRDLSHIQSFASEEYLARPRLGHRAGSFGPNTQFEISAMPVTDIIEMVAGLLTKITTTNDRQHEHLHRPMHTAQDQGNVTSPSQCVLAFHGKNVPGITILSYLSRIHKYCPTTYEVFLSLLVYFDRMTDNFNRKFMQKGQTNNTEVKSEHNDVKAEEDEQQDSSSSPMNTDSEPSKPKEDGETDQNDSSQYFVVDSYNIHRLVIAGVTCASKFFSDVFYTNSRYAKVGGLPLMELNNLELQFLLLNDFRLSIPVEELEAYGTMLVEFYAREIVAQEQAARVQHERMQQTTHTGDEVYMRGSDRVIPDSTEEEG